MQLSLNLRFAFDLVKAHVSEQRSKVKSIRVIFITSKFPGSKQSKATEQPAPGIVSHGYQECVDSTVRLDDSIFGSCDGLDRHYRKEQ